MTHKTGWSPGVVGPAEELVHHLKRRALLDEEDDHPYKVTIVDAYTTQQQDYIIIYRQRASPKLLGRSGNALELNDQFDPQQTPDKLAAILLQSMSEPSGDVEGSPPKQWPENASTSLTAVHWLS